MPFAQFSNFLTQHFGVKDSKRVSSINLGLLEIDGNFVIRKSHSKVLDSLLGESHLEGKSFLTILKHRTSSEEFHQAQQALKSLVTGGDITTRKKQKNPFDCLRIKMPSQSGKEIIKYIRCQFTQEDDYQRGTTWHVRIKDISKTIRISKLIKKSNEKAELKVNSIMSLLQFERDLVQEFLENTAASLRLISEQLSAVKQPKANLKRCLEDIFCIVHQIKGDAAIFNLQAVSTLAHEFEGLLSELSDKQNLTVKDFKRLLIPLKSMIFAIKEVKALFETISEGGWGSKKSDSGDSMMRRLDHLVQRLATDSDKRVIIVDDGFRDSAIPFHLRRAVNSILVQLTRNAVVHGIEDESTRMKHNKTPYGCLHVGVKHNGNKCIISLRDDGRGIDPDHIRKAALKSKIFNSQHVLKWNKNQLLNALFAPGFSLAPKLTQHAGRGIGLNSIKALVEKHGGTIGIQSEADHFTEFTMAFPRRSQTVA